MVLILKSFWIPFVIPDAPSIMSMCCQLDPSWIRGQSHGPHGPHGPGGLGPGLVTSMSQQAIPPGACMLTRKAMDCAGL